MNLLTRLTKPTAIIKNEFLIRKFGLFYKEKIRLKDIARIIAINKDAITHEETIICFEDSLKPQVWLSEFDDGFNTVMKQISELLPEFEFLPPILSRTAFENTGLVLWKKPLA